MHILMCHHCLCVIMGIIFPTGLVWKISFVVVLMWKKNLVSLQIDQLAFQGWCKKKSQSWINLVWPHQPNELTHYLIKTWLIFFNWCCFDFFLNKKLVSNWPFVSFDWNLKLFSFYLEQLLPKIFFLRKYSATFI